MIYFKGLSLLLALIGFLPLAAFILAGRGPWPQIFLRIFPQKRPPWVLPVCAGSGLLAFTTFALAFQTPGSLSWMATIYLGLITFKTLWIWAQYPEFRKMLGLFTEERKTLLLYSLPNAAIGGLFLYLGLAA